MTTMKNWDIGPDTEVGEDAWEAEQAIRADQERYAEVNSCDALRIIDGVTMEQDEDLQ
jgi:hypothetical protein